MKLNIEQTIARGSGYYGRDEIQLRNFGVEPATPNMPFRCYKHEGAIYHLFTDVTSGIGGFTCRWWVKPADDRWVKLIKALLPNRE